MYMLNQEANKSNYMKQLKSFGRYDKITLLVAKVYIGKRTIPL